MGSKVSTLVDIEKTSWIKEHKLEYNHGLRQEQLRLLANFGTELQACSNDNSLYGVQYQHWFIKDKLSDWVIEFGGGELSQAHVQVHCIDKKGFILHKKFAKTQSVQNRMEKVCGATNYSLALRNCEHLARYIQTGAWSSLQMVGSGILAETFNSYLKTHRKTLNTLPSNLKEEEGSVVPLYPPNLSPNIFHVKYTGLGSCLTDADNSSYNIVVLGPTGSGKSTIINNIFNMTVCKTGATAESVTKEVLFLKGNFMKNVKNPTTNQWELQYWAVNVIDTIGFCDSAMSSSEVLDVIKNSVKTNLSYIDKVIIICSGRIEQAHQDAIKNFMNWLSFKSYKKKFMFIYNKSDGLSEEEKLNNLTYMCDQLGADSGITTRWLDFQSGQWVNTPMNVALGFPPHADYETVREDHTDLIRAATAVFPEQRIQVDKSSCAIL